jgi:hypothetical protein
MEPSTPQWLVRTSQNLIAGPYSRDQVRQMILSGQLRAQDEVCRSNHYWIQLHEREEVSSELGADLLAHLALESDEEATLTRTDPAVTLRSSESEHSLDAQIPDLPDLTEYEEPQTSVLTLPKLERPPSPPEPRLTPSPRLYPDTRGERVSAIEPPSLWRWIIGALVFGCVLLLFYLLKRLQ